MKKILALAFLFGLTVGADAQTFPLNNIPIGKGPSKQGWTPVAPVNGQCLTASGGVPTFASCASLFPGGTLTKVDDTNVTLTLGGSPTTALVNAASLTLGWTGTLAVSRGGTGIAAFGTGIATWLGTPSSANLRAALTDESGTGAAYFQGGDIGTPSAGVITSLTGTCTACTANTFTAGNAANLTSGTLPPARLNGLNAITNSLGADVNLTVTNAYVDGPSIAQGSTGTWWVSGGVVLLDTVAAATFNCKLWDGTTVIDSATTSTTATNAVTRISFSGFLATPANNLRISCASTNGSPSGRIKFNSSGNSKDSTISAFRIN